MDLLQQIGFRFIPAQVTIIFSLSRDVVTFAFDSF